MSSPAHGRTRRSRGMTLIEVVIAIAITAVLIVGLGNVVLGALSTTDDARMRHRLGRDARFAMSRMVRAVSDSRMMLVPREDSPFSGNDESVRDPGVLVVLLPETLDRDLDGIADADNDGDGLVDEDLPRDANNDGAAGLVGIDDDGNGAIDDTAFGDRDDDESRLSADEDGLNGADDDSDGTVDEDPGADMNGDGAPGVAGVDDDGDGSTDEGDTNDDDEDGAVDEDWWDTVAYYVSGTSLVERYPNLDPVDGTDFSERVIASNVTLFRVERLPRGTNRTTLVEITLELGGEAETVRVQQRIRVGGPP